MLHILCSTLSPAELEYVKASVMQARPSMVLVMDNLDFAISLKPYVKHVVYRDWGWGDQNNVWDKYSPDEFVAIHMPAIQAGLWLYVDNEPGFNDTIIEWLYQTAVRILAVGGKAVVGNWAVGNPGENEWYKAHKLLQLCHNFPKRLAIGLHEYIETDWLHPFGMHLHPRDWDSVNIPTDVLPYTIGRYRWLIKYCKSVGLHVKIAFTEYGFDEVASVHDWQKTVPGYRYAMGINNCLVAFWIWGQGMNPVEYAYLSLKYAWEKLYYYYSNWFLGAVVFTVSGSSWEDFDLLNTNIIEYLKQNPFRVKDQENMEYVIVQPGSVRKSVEFTFYNVDGSPNEAGTVNIRRLPSTSAEKLGTIVHKQVMALYVDSEAIGSGYTWRRVQMADGGDAWVAEVPRMKWEVLGIKQELQEIANSLQMIIDTM